jgi:hypothetical protein
MFFKSLSSSISVKLSLEFLLDYFLIREPLCKVPQDINPDSSAKSAPVDIESPKMDKPLSPPAKKNVPETSKPPSPKDVQGSPGTSGAPPSPTHAALGHNPVGASLGPEPIESPETSLPSPSPMESGLPVGTKLVRARPCLSLKSHRSNIHGSRSLYGTTQNLSWPDSTSVGS